MEYSTSTRRGCFIEEDNGLASLADMEAGFSGNHHHHNFFSRSMASQRRGSLRCLPCGSLRSERGGGGRYEEYKPHFLEACFLCKKPLGDNNDIFMYRGDTPFCSEECRQEQIEIDEAKEKNWNLSVSMKALRQKDQKKSKSTSPNKAQDYNVRTSTLAAAY